MSFTQKEAIQVSELAQLTAAPIKSSVMPRWKRKALAASAATSSSHKRSASASTITPTTTTTTATTTSGHKRAVSATSCPTTPSAGDRFIPNRGAMDMDVSHVAMLAKENAGADEPATPSTGGNKRRKNMVVDEEGVEVATTAASARVLALTAKAPTPDESYTNSLKVLYSQNKMGGSGTGRAAKSTRYIPSAPERILDAPDLVDDYYLNLLSWSNANVLAVALGPTVYLWNAATGTIEELMHTEADDDFVCSVSWIKEGGGDYLAVGTNNAEVQLWDATKLKQVRNMRGHMARVGALDWNAHVLSSGSRDSNIFHHDVRVRDHHVGTLAGHEQEVCGLKWSPDGSTLASGSNDNTLCIWDSALSASVMAPRHRLTEHRAAVKALAWCPWQARTLASGGGTADRCIKFWNTSTGAMLNSIDTGSQVCSLLWSPHEKEILSSHGFSQNQLCLWKYPSMVKVKELTGHTARVLHMATSPDGSSVCSAGADETLRFWNIFGDLSSKAARSKDRSHTASSSLSGRSIR